MTVAELKDWLDDFDDQSEVCIGVQQTYGSNFAYDIIEVQEYTVSEFYEDEKQKRVVISEGTQIGTVDYDGYYDED